MDRPHSICADARWLGHETRRNWSNRNLSGLLHGSHVCVALQRREILVASSSLLTAYSVLAAKKLKLRNSVVTIYCTIFGIIGLVAILYSTRTSFADATSPYRYGDGMLRSTYYAAFRSCRKVGVEARDHRLMRAGASSANAAVSTLAVL